MAVRPGAHPQICILVALASGSYTSSAIAAHTGIRERHLYYYLQHLTELGYVSRRYPLTGDRPVARHVRFMLDDPLLRFWFRFVFPNVSYITQRGPERAFSELIRPHLDGYFGGCFEQLCRESLPYLYEEEGVNAAYEIGEFWDKQVQIDVVGYRQDDRIDIGECKWGTPASVPALVRELNAKMERYPNKRNATLQGRLFTRNTISTAESPAQIRCHSLEDLYG